MQRANVYSFFSRVFGYAPTDDFVDELKGQPLKDVLKNLGIVFDEIFDRETTAQELKKEYNALFEKTGARYTSPYESFYKGGGHSSGEEWTKTTMDVAQSYAKLEYEAETPFLENPDHIGVEVGFMEQLCLEEAESYTEGQKDKADFILGKQLEFMDSHLLGFAQIFTNNVKEKAKLDFYTSNAEVMLNFIESEKDYLKETFKKGGSEN